MTKTSKFKSLVLAFALFSVSSPALAVDLTNEQPTTAIEVACRAVNNELSKAARYGWSVSGSIVGEAKDIFLKNFNDLPPPTNFKAQTIVLLNRPGIAKTAVLLVDEKGCIVAKPVFVTDEQLAKLKAAKP